MKKKIKYIIFTLISILCFNKVIFAEEACTYIGMTNDPQNALTGEFGATYPTYYVRFKVSANGESLSDFSTNISDNLTSVSNWNESYEPFGVNDSGKSYFISNKKCAPYMVSLGGGIFAVDAANLKNIKNFAKNNGSIYVVMNLSSDKYIINYHANSKFATGTMEPLEVNYDYYFGPTFLNIKFENKDYMKLGWTIQCEGKWLCKLESEIGYSSSCSDDNKVILKDYESHYIPVLSTISSVDLYAKWKSVYGDSESVIDYNESECKVKGYVWNKDGGYCNTDKLQYVACGDAYDIPAQVPSLISFAVNLLKIATPIILIIISIITLVKAIASTKEDEIKKAQNSLVRKVMSAVIVFFVISIVQFVILKVADDRDHKSITACLTCFLNNDCKTVKYYKTNILGDYYCTIVGSNKTKTCESFYKEN